MQFIKKSSIFFQNKIQINKEQFDISEQLLQAKLQKLGEENKDMLRKLTDFRSRHFQLDEQVNKWRCHGYRRAASCGGQHGSCYRLRWKLVGTHDYTKRTT